MSLSQPIYSYLARRLLDLPNICQHLTYAFMHASHYSMPSGRTWFNSICHYICDSRHHSLRCNRCPAALGAASLRHQRNRDEPASRGMCGQPLLLNHHHGITHVVMLWSLMVCSVLHHGITHVMEILFVLSLCCAASHPGS